MRTISVVALVGAVALSVAVSAQVVGPHHMSTQVSTQASAQASTDSGVTMAPEGITAPAPGEAPSPKPSAASGPSANPTTAAGSGQTGFTAYGATFRMTVEGGVLTIDSERIGGRRIDVTRSASAKGVEYTGQDRGRDVALIIRSGTCIDTAGVDTGMRASFVYGQRMYRGCAVEGVLPIATT